MTEGPLEPSKEIPDAASMTADLLDPDGEAFPDEELAPGSTPPEEASIAPQTSGPPPAASPQAPSSSHAEGPEGAPPLLSGLRKAAIFILCLEEEAASALMRSLSSEELSRIEKEVPNLGVVEKETMLAVLEEFRGLEEIQAAARRVRSDGRERAARGPQKSRRARQLPVPPGEAIPFSFLEAGEIETLMAFLEEEHPQTLAIVLAHLSPAKAAEVLERLAPAVRGDVMKRIAALEVVNAEALSLVEMALQKHLEAVHIEPLGETGGIRAVAEILRAAGDGAETFLEDIRQERPDLAEEVGKQLFVFEDLVRLEDRAIQVVLKEVEPRCLALALKSALPEVKQKMLDNLSRRACEIVREELEILGPVKISDVEAARKSILDTVLRLERSGQLFISGRGREENRIVY